MKNEEEILRNFNKIFEISKIGTIDKSKFPLILKLFEQFREDMFVENEEYKKLKKEKKNLLDKINKEFNNKQNQLFESYWEIESKLSSILEKEIFLFGYLIRNELESEK